ncbi:DUF4923 family protein [Bacteroides heparinolyticus]|uniref:DUF4923 family protein n=3 Tax=Prevotella heparinolytica TaxID=28113 RepID=UPI0023F30463|nr:DUF4923 family protein [Bacteroides heparinolyticus]MCI6213688.1 DUF4923 family protein [Bacteroides heparinolyticus]
MKKIILGQLLIAAMFMPTCGRAQTLSDLFNKAVETVTGKNTAIIDMVGTWSYTGAAVDFKSDNLLKKAGGLVAASAAESKLDEQLAKVGIKEGQMSFTFNADSTFNAQIGRKKMSGTYSYNSTTQKVNLKFARLIGMNAKIDYSSAGMDLLFDSDKLLKLLIFFGSKSNNTAIKSVSSLASSYDGMMTGFTLKKKS